MSVYKSPKSRFYQYDFQYKGKRYTGSTGVETLRKAEEVERKIRADAALGLFDDLAGMTLDEAAGRWWVEVGQHLKTGKPKDKAAVRRPKGGRKREAADYIAEYLDALQAVLAEKRNPAKPSAHTQSDVERRLEILLRLLGPNTRLVDLTTRKISDAIEKRRGETYQRAPDRPGKPAKRYPVSNATVNADIIITLRRIMTRAEEVWEIKPMPQINWKGLKLKEPEPELRIYSAAQRRAWLDQCDPVTAKALEFLLRYGLRLNELFFPPEAFKPRDEFAGPRVAINKRKRGVMLLPLREDDSRDVGARVGRAVAAGLETIWFEEMVIPAAGKRAEQVILIPMTYYGIQARLNSAAARAGLKMSRIIHGSRHHAGTVFLAKSKNLKLTQELLGHADIKSTMRYAHALEADLRAALEDEPAPEQSQNSPGASEQETPQRAEK